MQKVGKFEKVSFEQFAEALSELFESHGKEVSNKDLVRYAYDNLELPKRATAGSAGYDFKAPISFTLKPGESIKLPTGIRAKIEDGWFLMCVPRSGLGFKYRLQLDNVVAVVDADYINADNEGHIFAKITNCGSKELTVEAGKGFLQGIFLPFGITEDDHAEGERTGGMGSTDK